MNTALQAGHVQRLPMTVAALDAVLAVELATYEFPWSRGNFIDSLAAGYRAELLRASDDGSLIAYSMAMPGVDEMHLLNLAVAPPFRRSGYARLLLDALVADSRAAGAQWLWLEVRQSNERARSVYQRYGFAEVGTRRAYYPAAAGRRENAVVMRLPLGSDHALV